MKTSRTIKRLVLERPKGLPSLWEVVRLGDIADLINGFAFTPRQWRREGLPIIRIQNLNDPEAPFNFFEGELPERFRVRSGELLFAWSGTPGTSFGAHIWQGGDAWLNQHIFKVDFDRSSLHPEYLQAAINHNLESYIAEAQGGGGLAHVNKRFIDDSMIALAPFNEQQRIVQAIRHTNREIDEGEAALRRARITLKQFTLSVLKTAVEGGLTADWRSHNPKQEQATKPVPTGSERRRGSQSGALTLPPVANALALRNVEGTVGTFLTLPSTWIWTRVGDVGEVRVGRQRTPRSKRGAKLRPYLRVANVFEDRIDTSDVLRMPFTNAEARTYALRTGDVLLNEGQSLELVGRPAIYRGEVPGACFQNTLIRFRAHPSVVPEFALLVFRYYLRARRFQRSAKWTTNIAHLSAGRFCEIEFPLPPYAEQQKIMHDAKVRLAEVAQSERAIDEGLLRSVGLRRSTLRRALSGTLVPQDQHDEPASALLERIRASKTNRLAERKAAMSHNRRQSRMAQDQPRRTLAQVLGEHRKGITPEDLFKTAGFDLAHVDDFYAELRSLQSRLTEQRPPKGEERRWPNGSHILIRLKGK